MADILQIPFWNAFSINEEVWIPIEISLKVYVRLLEHSWVSL